MLFVVFRNICAVFSGVVYANWKISIEATILDVLSSYKSKWSLRIVSKH